MTATTQDSPVYGAAAPSFSRLLNTELRRFWARRFTRVLLALSVIGYLVAMIFMWATHAQPTAADLAQATEQRDQTIAQMQQYYDECIAQPGQGNDLRVRADC